MSLNIQLGPMQCAHGPVLCGRQSVARARHRLLPCVLALLICAGCANSASADLKAFTTDGCSAFPDGTPAHRDLWLNCCVVHDFAYWKGGARDERKRVDEELQSCVAKVGEPTIAGLMLAGVRAGGTPYLPTRFRWGYGWPYPRGYRELSAEELEQVRARSAHALQAMQREMSGDALDRPE